MSIRNQNWYNLQATRRYPLDENSTGLDDANNVIRDDILADCHIRFPSTYGKYVYVQGITVSAGIVTVIFGVAEAADFVTGAPLAAVSVVKPVTPYINYVVNGLQPGVSGWVVFGPGIENAFVGRYTTVKQSLVSPRCARSYTPLPIPTIGKLGLQSSLQGVVNILGQLPVKVRYAQNAGRVVDMSGGTKNVVQQNVSALVVELDAQQTTENYNPLSLFLGPCGQRPESGTCPKTPIESINGIAPDCAGNIEIVFENFETVDAFKNCGGVDVVSDSNLPDVCDATKPKRPETPSDNCCTATVEISTETELQNVPEFLRVAGLIAKTTDTGELWRLADDLVTWTITNSAEYCSWPDPTDLIPDVIIDELPPEPDYPAPAIPLCIDFSACGGSTLFTTRSGKFELATIQAPTPCTSCLSSELDATTINSGVAERTSHPTYATVNTSTINLITLNSSPTDWTLNKTIAAELSIGSSGIERNAGIVLNYRQYLNELGATQTTFVAVVLDSMQGAVRVLRYTNNFVTVEATAAMPIRTGRWYRLFATPVSNGSHVAVNVYAEEMTAANPATASIVAQIAAGAYGELIGAAGLMANRSFAYFNQFTVTD